MHEIYYVPCMFPVTKFTDYILRCLTSRFEANSFCISWLKLCMLINIANSPRTNWFCSKLHHFCDPKLPPSPYTHPKSFEGKFTLRKTNALLKEQMIGELRTLVELVREKPQDAESAKIPDSKWNTTNDDNVEDVKEPLYTTTTTTTVSWQKI